MYRQPVQPSIANATGPAVAGSNRVSQPARCSRSAGLIRPRSHLSFCSSTQSNVSCFRWMSRPPTIDIGTSSSSVTIDVQRRRTTASELRRPPESADRQDPERSTPRLNPPTATGRCMSSDLPMTMHLLKRFRYHHDGILQAVDAEDSRVESAACYPGEKRDFRC